MRAMVVGLGREEWLALAATMWAMVSESAMLGSFSRGARDDVGGGPGAISRRLDDSEVSSMLRL